MNLGASLTHAIISSDESEVMNGTVRYNLRLTSKMAVCVILCFYLVSFCVHSEIT